MHDLALFRVPQVRLQLEPEDGLLCCSCGGVRVRLEVAGSCANTVQCIAMHCSLSFMVTAQCVVRCTYHAAPGNASLHCTASHCTTLHYCTVPHDCAAALNHCTALHSIATLHCATAPWYCNAPPQCYTALHRTSSLHRTALHHTSVMHHYIALHCNGPLDCTTSMHYCNAALHRTAPR